MLSLPVVTMDGSDAGVYEFDPASLASSISKQLLHDVVVMYERNRRVGTVQTRSRGMVAGSTKKLFRQKGTGRARMGNKRTNLRRGGGVAFGKTNVDYYYRLPKKAVRTATRMALLSKFQDDQATMLDVFSVESPKTSVVAASLTALGLSEQSTLLVVPEYDKTVWLSCRNIPNLKVLPAADLNAYVLLRQRRLLIVKDAMDRLVKREAVAV